MTRPEGCFTVFGRNGVMPGQTGLNQKREGSKEGKDALR